ncbi:deoxynucleoside triphosphate triphosphohydrolase SAMHD1-like [Diadema setosum]|uniref:deoxynucleoside triphosphate triphosphohydrolase SAMHD1-like n=1 Tax=Diadema setosum TaxID=31175 RepID=UPI003B39FEA7
MKTSRRSHGPELEDSESNDGTSSSSNNWRAWSPDQVQEFFQSRGLNDEGAVMKREKIEGSLLLDVTDERLKSMGISACGDRIKIMKAINSLTKKKDQELKIKVFNDPVHGHIDLHPLLIRIIDTPQFQRLRFIKQLGCSYFVFPGAAHNRFEHSLGVAFLAGELVRTLKRKQPELGITAKDLLCVQIAGLCHDLGHGPFSHMFDNFFIPKVRPDIKWKHEHLSVRMFDHLIKENELEAAFKKYELDEDDLVFIREQIEGPQKEGGKQGAENWAYKGRGKMKCYLYEIVANKRNGIDVDKWDYFARDCHNLGIANSFDHWRFMTFARVLEVDGEMQICSRDKEVGNLYDMFHTRNTLHRRAYQHKVNKIIETMIVEALVKADSHLRLFPGKDGKLLTMSESLDDMHAYTQVTDSVLEHIIFSRSPELEESRAIIQKVLTRQLYKCVGQSQPPGTTKLESEFEICKQICTALSDEELGGPQLDLDDLIVHVVKLDYGMGNQNPVDYVRFYSKEDPSKAIMIRKGQVSQMLPENFVDRYIRLYCKHRDAESLQKAERCFYKWCEDQGFGKPKPGNMLDPAMTPFKQDGEKNNEEDQPPRKKSKTNLVDKF